jgi:hypothetical protein
MQGLKHILQAVASAIVSYLLLQQNTTLQRQRNLMTSRNYSQKQEA